MVLRELGFLLLSLSSSRKSTILHLKPSLLPNFNVGSRSGQFSLIVMELDYAGQRNGNGPELAWKLVELSNWARSTQKLALCHVVGFSEYTEGPL